MTCQVSQNTSYHSNFCVFDIKNFGIFSKNLAFFPKKNWHFFKNIGLFSKKIENFISLKSVFGSKFVIFNFVWFVDYSSRNQKSEDRHFFTLRRYLQVKQLFWWNKKSEDRYFLTLQRYLQVKQLLEPGKPIIFAQSFFLS